MSGAFDHWRSTERALRRTEAYSENGGPEMRCEDCGRLITNAELWRLGWIREAPIRRSLLQLCERCRHRHEVEREPRGERVRESHAA